MQRPNTGRYETTATANEQVQAFVPAPLPPVPALVLDGPLLLALSDATTALGRLDGVSVLLPHKGVFLYSYVRKEAVLSSQIEGTQSSLSDLLLSELSGAPGVAVSDVAEVSRYIAALEHGMARLREGFPLSNRLIREIHKVLMSHGRGSHQTPGEFRRSQNWIGGTRPGNAAHVPPPHSELPGCMSALEKFIHAEGDGIPALLRAGLAHVQFETIHPFLDGNGRVGRLLIALQLCNAGILREPLLYLSLYFKKHRSVYYEMLNTVRKTGDWEAWLLFFLEGVHEVAEDAFNAANEMDLLFKRDHEKIANAAGQRTGSCLRLHEVFKQRPALTLPEAHQQAKMSYDTAATAMDVLTKLGIAKEQTGRARNKVFFYRQYYKILLDEGEG